MQAKKFYQIAVSFMGYTREIFNILDAIDSKADIITISSDYLAKLKYENYDLDKFSNLFINSFFKTEKN